MSDLILDATEDRPDRLHGRIMALGREALEGHRPLSDLLGDALRELRSAHSRIRALEQELRGRESAPREPGASPEQRRDDVRAATLPAFRGDGGETLVVEDAPAPGEPPVAGLDLPPHTFAAGAPELEAALRERIAGALYLGTLAAGDRLPSVRELARRTGLNHKIIRRVYRSLERSGVVQVRERSGIYVAEVKSPEMQDLDPAGTWLVGILLDAVRQGIRADALPRLVERAVATRPLRCACVESTEDDRFALCEEVERRFGLRAVPVGVRDGRPATPVADADLVITTPFHADSVRRELAPGKPLVIARLHPGVRQLVRARSAGEPVRLLCVDRTSGERLRNSFGPAEADRMRVVTVDELGADGQAASGPAVATRAAWARVGGKVPSAELPVLPYLAESACRQIASLLVRFNWTVSAG